MPDLLLDADWDVTATPSGDIAMAGDDYSIAQAVGNEIKLILGEGWYDPTQGIALQSILSGKGTPDFPLIRSVINGAAQEVSSVADAQTIINYDRTTRTLGGNVLVTTVTGATLNVTI